MAVKDPWLGTVGVVNRLQRVRANLTEVNTTGTLANAGFTLANRSTATMNKGEFLLTPRESMKPDVFAFVGGR